jgi:hypothetical protein
MRAKTANFLLVLARINPFIYEFSRKKKRKNADRIGIKK